jgi:hypothetical protein
METHMHLGVEKCYRGDVHLSPLLILILKKTNSIKKIKPNTKKSILLVLNLLFFNIKKRRGDG